MSAQNAFAQASSNSLDSEKISSLLSLRRHDFTGKLKVFSSVESTNTLAKDLLARSASLLDADGNPSSVGKEVNGAVFIAESQSGGRGRLGRSFYSPPGAGLYMSLVIVPTGGVSSPALITASAAVGVCRALQSVCGLEAKIKWVNDLFLHGKKICGILTEGVFSVENQCVSAAVIGIGINVTEPLEGFPPEIASVAGSLAGHTADIDRNELAAAVIQEVFTAVNLSLSGCPSVLAEYQKKSLFTPGQSLVICPTAGSTEHSFSAFYEEIDSQARLVVRLPDGERRFLDSGEVTLHSGSVAR